jgi:hypothetical protein
MLSRLIASRRTRKALLLPLLAAALLSIGLVVALFSALNPTDPDQQIGVVSISDAQAVTPPGGALSRRVPGLDEVKGLVSRDDPDDVDELDVGRVELDFGPDNWVAAAEPIQDYDNDGTVEAVRDELSGLVGQEARFLVRLDSDGDDGDVYTINGRPYRDPAGPPPWNPSGANEADIRRAAAAAVGAGASVMKLEAQDYPLGWEAKVVDAARREYKVDLDASGKVLAVEPD